MLVVRSSTSRPRGFNCKFVRYERRRTFSTCRAEKASNHQNHQIIKIFLKLGVMIGLGGFEFEFGYRLETPYAYGTGVCG